MKLRIGNTVLENNVILAPMAGVTDTDLYTEEELSQVRSIMRVAILYAFGYLYEHREEADHHALLLTRRSLLFAVREGVNF